MGVKRQGAAAAWTFALLLLLPRLHAVLLHLLNPLRMLLALLLHFS
jgi:hypothetical protein